MKQRTADSQLSAPGDIWWRLRTLRRSCEGGHDEAYQRELIGLRLALVGDGGPVCRRAIQLLDGGHLDEAVALLEPLTAEAGAARMRRWAER